MKFTEMEFKYNADNISLKQFTEFCEMGKNKPISIFKAAGWDHFYDKPGEDQSFCRHRVGEDYNQLTFKRKTSDKNSYIRTEHNLDLKQSVSRELIADFLKAQGYEYNTTIWKNCFIYSFDTYILVYYIIYDEELKEKGRFYEIEMKEDYNWLSEAEAWSQLQLMEKLSKPLGVNAQMRIKNSLFEMYKK